MAIVLLATVSARGARAAAGEVGDWVPQLPVHLALERSDQQDRSLPDRASFLARAQHLREECHGFEHRNRAQEWRRHCNGKPKPFLLCSWPSPTRLAAAWSPAWRAPAEISLGSQTTLLRRLAGPIVSAPTRRV